MSDSTHDNARRRFLKTAAVAGGAATVAVAGASAVTDADPAPRDRSAAPEPEGKRGYHVTPHIETYYRLARQ